MYACMYEWMDTRMDGWMCGCIYIYVVKWLQMTQVRQSHPLQTCSRGTCPVDVTKYHACHVKRRWMSQSLKVPRLPRKVQLHVSKCHACHASAATCRQVPRLSRKKLRRPRRLLGTERATRSSPVPYVPRLPHETKVDVSKCNACHAKCSYMSYMSPSATPATQVPRLPLCVSKLCVSKLCVSKLCVSKLHVSKCHACHAKCSYMSPSATPATQKAAATTATAENRARQQSQPSAIRATPIYVPRLPRETKVDVSKSQVQLHVAKCHACHAKSRGDHGDCWEPSVPPEPAQCHT